MTIIGGADGPTTVFLAGKLGTSLFLLPLIIGILIQVFYIRAEYKHRKVGALILKSFASLCFVLTGICCAGGVFSSYVLLILLGLFCGMIGDIVLNLQFLAGKHADKLFIAGTLVFLIGHLFYLGAFLSETSSDKMIWAAVTGILAARFVISWVMKRAEADNMLLIVGKIYLMIIVLMVSAALGRVIIDFSTSHLMLAMGAFLFAFSDMVLILDQFCHKKNRYNVLINLSTYYAGQMLIALSLLGNL